MAVAFVLRRNLGPAEKSKIYPRHFNATLWPSGLRRVIRILLVPLSHPYGVASSNLAGVVNSFFTTSSICVDR